MTATTPAASAALDDLPAAADEHVGPPVDADHDLDVSRFTQELDDEDASR